MISLFFYNEKELLPDEEHLEFEDHEAYEIGQKLLFAYSTLKVKWDMRDQKVDDAREAYLIRSADTRDYCYFEVPMELEESKEVFWKWTPTSRVLQGYVRFTPTGTWDKKYSWCSKQKQFTKTMHLPNVGYFFSVSPQKLSYEEYFGV